MSNVSATLLSKAGEISDGGKIKVGSEISDGVTIKVDVIGDVLDNCRSWQLRTIFIIYLTKIPTAFFMACIVYSAPIPQRVPIYCMDTNTTLTTIKHPTVVSVDDKVFHLSFCDTIADIKDHANEHYGNESYEMPWTVPSSESNKNNRSNIIPCDFFDFKSGKSVTTYDVVCSRGGFVVVTQGMHLVGIFFSGIVLRYALKV